MHDEPNPYGKDEDAHAPYEYMRELCDQAHVVLDELIKYSSRVSNASQTNHAARAAHDAVSGIIIGEPE